jgi:hypothetical protein
VTHPSVPLDDAEAEDIAQRMAWLVGQQIGPAELPADVGSWFREIFPGGYIGRDQMGYGAITPFIEYQFFPDGSLRLTVCDVNCRPLWYTHLRPQPEAPGAAD